MIQSVATDIVIRECESLAELDACVELQRCVWGYSDQDVTPSSIFVVARKTGGHVLGLIEGWAADLDRRINELVQLRDPLGRLAKRGRSLSPAD